VNYMTARVTLELGDMSGAYLQDERLGDGGAVYLCNGRGTVLASNSLQDVLAVDHISGHVQFRFIWDISGASWAQELKNYLKHDTAIAVTFLSKDRKMVTVSPLASPLSRFVVVAIAKDRGQFTNDGFLLVSSLSIVIGVVPYIGAFAVAFVLIRRQCRILEEHPERNPLDDDYDAARQTRMRRMTRKIASRVSQGLPFPTRVFRADGASPTASGSKVASRS